MTSRSPSAVLSTGRPVLAGTCVLLALLCALLCATARGALLTGQRPTRRGCGGDELRSRLGQRVGTFSETHSFLKEEDLFLPKLLQRPRMEPQEEHLVRSAPLRHD